MSRNLDQVLAMARVASYDLLDSLRQGEPPSDECLERRGRLLREIADAIPLASATGHSGELRALAELDAQIRAAAELCKARLAMESLRLQKERVVLRFADGGRESGPALTLSA